MNLENLEKSWDSFAQIAPLWSVLTVGESKDYKWDEQEFFYKGELAIKRILDHMAYAWIKTEKHRVLDFGCGVGRLSVHLADHFEEVYGVDLSKHMLEHAKHYSTKFGRPNCNFIHNPRSDLSFFEDDHFDFIVSMITLQHTREAYIYAYLKEFIRILRPNGVVYFQLPDQIKLRASYECYRDGSDPEMELHGIARSSVIDFLEANGTQVQAVIEDNCCGMTVRSFRYIAIKK